MTSGIPVRGMNLNGSSESWIVNLRSGCSKTLNVIGTNCFLKNVNLNYVCWVAWAPPPYGIKSAAF